MTPPTLGLRFEDALLFAVRTHDGDVRKGAGEIPYVSHLLSVCALVLEDGGDEDEAIAALLHDTLEDHPEEVTKADLERRLGARVADLVVRCTDTPPDYRGGTKPHWHERKPAYVERIREEGYPLCRVALADKLHNTRSIVLDHCHSATRSGSASTCPRRTSSSTIGISSSRDTTNRVLAMRRS